MFIDYTNNNNKKLILFFHGWGGQPHMLDHLQLPSDSDLMIFHNYIECHIDPKILAKIKSYPEIHLISWSFGVWMADYICLQYNIQPTTTLACNGTLWPIDDTRGIPPHIASATLKHLNESSLKKFRRRMLGSQSALHALDKRPNPLRSASELYQELEILYNRFAQQKINHRFYQKAIVGLHDMIFPVSAQYRAWQEDKVECLTIEAPHFCFQHISNWNELL